MTRGGDVRNKCGFLGEISTSLSILCEKEWTYEPVIPR